MTLCFFSEDFYSECETLFRPDLDGKPVLVLARAKTPLSRDKIISANKAAKELGFLPGDFLTRNGAEPEGFHLFYENNALYADIARRMLCVCERFAGRAFSDNRGTITAGFDDTRTGNFPAFSARIASCIKKETGIRVQVKPLADTTHAAQEADGAKKSGLRKSARIPSLKLSAGQFRANNSPRYTTDTSALPVVR